MLKLFPFLFKVVTTTLIITAIILNLYIHNYYKGDSNCEWSNRNGTVKLMAFGDPQIRGVVKTSSFRTSLDILGNDYYLGHIFHTLVSNLKPTHVAIMGDLISSQWISDEEFYKRGERFSNRIFRRDLLPPNAHFFNICGNHDIGYAGEITHERVHRFRNIYGSLNYVKEYEEGYRVVVLNSLAIDGPVWEQQYHDEVIEFLDQLGSHTYNGPTILLTHVPMYKPEGICKDSPYFLFYGQEYRGVLREQNQLSQESTKKVLNSIFNPEFGGVIVTGHDHEGCVLEYEYQLETDNWNYNLLQNKKRLAKTSGKYKIIEATVRSMMGEYGGNAGLITGEKNGGEGNWRFTYTLCPFQVQHVWWVTQILSILAVMCIGVKVLPNFW